MPAPPQRLAGRVTCACVTQTFATVLALRLPDVGRFVAEMLQPVEAGRGRRTELRGESSSLVARVHASLLQQVGSPTGACVRACVCVCVCVCVDMFVGVSSVDVLLAHITTDAHRSPLGINHHCCSKASRSQGDVAARCVQLRASAARPASGRRACAATWSSWICLATQLHCPHRQVCVHIRVHVCV